MASVLASKRPLELRQVHRERLQATLAVYAEP